MRPFEDDLDDLDEFDLESPAASRYLLHDKQRDHQRALARKRHGATRKSHRKDDDWSDDDFHDSYDELEFDKFSGINTDT